MKTPFLNEQWPSGKEDGLRILGSMISRVQDL